MRNVTRHVTRRDTDRDMSRVTVHVSHATTTTPHYTKSLVAVICGEFGQGLHACSGDLPSPPRCMSGYAADFSGGF